MKSSPSNLREGTTTEEQKKLSLRPAKEGEWRQRTKTGMRVMCADEGLWNWNGEHPDNELKKPPPVEPGNPPADNCVSFGGEGAPSENDESNGRAGNLIEKVVYHPFTTSSTFSFSLEHSTRPLLSHSFQPLNHSLIFQHARFQRRKQSGGSLIY